MVANNVRLFLLGEGRQASRLIVWVIGFFAFLNVYSLQAVLPMVMGDFHATPVQAGLAVGATVLAIGLVSPFIGLLSDALGRKSVLCASIFFLTLPTALIPLAGSFGTLIGLRFLQGLAIPGIVVVFIAYIAEEFHSGGVARITGTFVGGTVMGGFCGRFITGHAGELLGWRGAFFTLAIMNLLGAIAIWRLLPASKNFIANKNFRAGFQTFRYHLQNRRLLSACAAGFSVLFSLVGAFTYANIYLAGSPFHLSSSDLANVFAVYLVGVFVTPMAARYLDRLGYMRSLQVGMAISITGLVLSLVPTLLFIILGLAVCSTGVFLTQSATISAIAKSVVNGRSMATGIYYMFYYAGGAVGSWVVGIAFESHGWIGSVMTIIAFQLLGASAVTAVWKYPAQKS